MTPSAGEFWLADRGDETRRLVFVVSDSRFHRLAERAVVAPVLDEAPAQLRPWHISIGEERIIAVNLAGTVPTERLLERADVVAGDALVRVRRAARAIIG
ncbi:type II toxin-antitoxin system PemK/MazF family toxin [Desertimonas flava]|uniref:type II toxin-antitoxin system PemK/MazF family toxin n=1 Tax=Desertimonas flava TaxID=2064846 RepID=UPI000E34E70B|nr:type II toxin-antitoxin system PemK/MazF family toxin [Desertimonas flava]